MLQNSSRLTFFTNMLLSLQTRPLTITFFHVNKRHRIPKGQSKMDNPGKLATQITQDEEKQNTICVSITIRKQTQIT